MSRANFSRTLTISLVLVAVLTFWIVPDALAGGGPPDSGTGTVTFFGNVYYSDAITPMQGILVEVYYPDYAASPFQATTDASGHYSIAVPYTGQLQYTVSAKLADRSYLYENGMVETSNEYVRNNFFASISVPTATPQPDVYFSGHVYTERGPIVEAPVTLRYWLISLNTTTDTNGYYYFHTPYYGGDALIYASYFTSQPFQTTPAPGETVVHDFSFLSVRGNFGIDFDTYVDGVRRGPVDFTSTYAGSTGTLTYSDGVIRGDWVVVGSDPMTCWVVCEGRESDHYTFTPEVNQVFRHSFQIGAAPTPTATATAAPATPTPTAAPSPSPTMAVTPTPTTSPTVATSATITATPAAGTTGDTLTSTPTSAAESTPTATPSATPATGGSKGFCGAMLLPLLVVGIASAGLWYDRKKGK